MFIRVNTWRVSWNTKLRITGGRVHDAHVKKKRVKWSELITWVVAFVRSTSKLQQRGRQFTNPRTAFTYWLVDNPTINHGVMLITSLLRSAGRLCWRTWRDISRKFYVVVEQPKTVHVQSRKDSQNELSEVNGYMSVFNLSVLNAKKRCGDLVWEWKNCSIKCDEKFQIRHLRQNDVILFSLIDSIFRHCFPSNRSHFISAFVD